MTPRQIHIVCHCGREIPATDDGISQKVDVTCPECNSILQTWLRGPKIGYVGPVKALCRSPGPKKRPAE